MALPFPDNVQDDFSPVERRKSTKIFRIAYFDCNVTSYEAPNGMLIILTSLLID